MQFKHREIKIIAYESTLVQHWMLFIGDSTFQCIKTMQICVE